jgi:RHS repeat-associated protein
MRVAVLVFCVLAASQTALAQPYPVITSGTAGPETCTNCTVSVQRGQGAGTGSKTFKAERETRVGFHKSPGGEQAPVPRVQPTGPKIVTHVPTVMVGGPPTSTPPGGGQGMPVAQVQGQAAGRALAGTVACGAACGQAQPPSENPAVPTPTGNAEGAIPAPNQQQAKDTSSDPVNPMNGEFVHQVVDLSLPGWIPYEHVRTYRSRVRFTDVLGPAWDHSYNQRLVWGQMGAAGGAACGRREIWYANGKAESIYFKESPVIVLPEVYEPTPAPWPKLYVTRAIGGEVTGFRMVERDGVIRTFDAEGLLATIENQTGDRLTVSWGTVAGGARGITSVTDTVGRVIDYHYYPSGRLKDVNPRGSTFFATYQYNPLGELSQGKGVDGRTENYTYQVGAPDGVGHPPFNYYPEQSLLASCEAACAPATASCQSTGVCDSIMESAMSGCAASCRQCQDLCSSSCLVDCNSGCKTACRSECTTHCNSPAGQAAIAQTCQTIWTNQAAGQCSDDACRNSCDSSCGGGCSHALSCLWEGALESAACQGDTGTCATAGAVAECSERFGPDVLSFVGEDLWDLIQTGAAGFWDGVQCVFSWVPGVDCDAKNVYEQWNDFCNNHCRNCCWRGEDCGTVQVFNQEQPSCNQGVHCTDDCRNAFFSGTTSCGNVSGKSCPRQLTGQCAEVCACDAIINDNWNSFACSNSSCQSGCFDTCNNGCVSSCREQNCGTACVADCQSAQTLKACGSGCVAGCVEQSRANGPFAGPKFGYHQDLYANLIEITDGRSGFQVLKNVYGSDVRQTSFDAVTSQTIGHLSESGGQLAYKYAWYDPAVGLDADFLPLSSYQAVDFCQDSGEANSFLFVTDGTDASKGLKPVRATKVTDPYGAVWTYYFNAQGRVVREVNQGAGEIRKVETSYEYDDQGRVTGIREPLGSRTCIRYDDGAAPSVTTRDYPVPLEAGLATEKVRLLRHEYTSFPFRLTRVVTGKGEVLQSAQWDSLGRQLLASKGTATRSFVPGAHGLPQSYTDNALAVTALEFQQGILTKKTTDAPGTRLGTPVSPPSVTSIVLDPYGRVSERITPLGAKETTVWDPNFFIPQSITMSGDGKSSTRTFTFEDGRVKYVMHGTTSREVYIHDLKGSLRLHDREPQPSTPTTRQRTCMLYGPGDRLLEVVNPEGDRVRYSYDGKGRLTRVQAGFLTGDLRTWDDDCEGNWVSDRPVAATIQAVAYDDNGRPTHVTDGNGLVTRLHYAGYREPSIIEKPAGEIVHMGHDDLGRETWVASHRSSVPYARPTLITASLMSMEEFQWDAEGVKNIRRWNFENTPSTQPGTAPLQAHRRPPAGDTYETFNRAGDIFQSHQVVNRTTSRYFDGSGRLRSIVYPNGAYEAFEYSNGGKTLKRTWTADGGVVRSEQTTLSEWGGPLTWSYSDEEVSLSQTWVYDGKGRLEETRSANGSGNVRAYDVFDRVRWSSVSPAPNASADTRTIEYDRNGRVRSVDSQAADNPTRSKETWTYDTLGRPVRRDHSDGRAVRYFYEPEKVRLSYYQDDHVITQPRYDAGTGLITSVDWTPQAAPPMPVLGATFAYDPKGRPIYGRVPGTLAPQIETYFAYDSLRRLSLDTTAGTDTWAVNNYDAHGEKYHSNYSGVSINRLHDELGRLTWVRAQGSAVELFYGAKSSGGPIRRVDTHGSPSTRPNFPEQTEYAYDGKGLLKRIDYFDAGRTSATQPAGKVWTGSRLWSLGANDGLPRAMQVKGGYAPGWTLYQVDALGRSTAEAQVALPEIPDGFRPKSNAELQSYFQPTFYSNPNIARGSYQKYVLDGRSNIRDLVQPHWIGVEYSLPSTLSGDRYTAFANRTRGESQNLTYDRRGNIETSAQISHTKDARNVDVKWTSVSTWQCQTIPCTTQTDKTLIDRDAFGRLVFLGREGWWNPPLRTRVAYDGSSVATYSYREESGFKFDVYLRGNDPDSYLMSVRPGSDVQTGFFHQDRDNNVVAVERSRGDKANNRYDVLGQRSHHVANYGVGYQTVWGGELLGYRGRIHHVPFHSIGQLVDMGARTYRTDLGRFASPDPIGFAGGTNVWAYAFGAPLKYHDPSGFEPSPMGRLDVFQRSNQAHAGSLTGQQVLYLLPPGSTDPTQIQGLTVPLRSARQIHTIRIENGKVHVIHQNGGSDEIGHFVKTAESDGIEGTVSPLDFMNYTKAAGAVVGGIKTLGRFSKASKTFFSVQGESDVARLLSGGAPWPSGVNKSFVGEGFYAWGTKAEAEAYKSLLEKTYGAKGLRILEARIPVRDYAKLKRVDLRGMADAAQDAWIEKYSFPATHGFEHVIRGTNSGTEYFFSKDVFNLFSF